MAELLRADGTREKVEPRNGHDFQLDELQEYVGGHIEMVRTTLDPNDRALVIDEEGKLKGKQFNATATEIAANARAIGAVDFIVGDAVLIQNKELR